MAQAGKPKTLLRKQAIMRRVILATIPCILGSIYFFGWRALAVILVSCAVGVAAEYVTSRRRGEPVSEAIFVTAILFALVMPPTVPWHVVVIGMLFAVVFTKELFGGFGRNIFNPALAGRCFVYICFPVALTAVWAPPATDWSGGFTKWNTYETQPGAFGLPVAAPDSITGATPMAKMKAAGVAVREAPAENKDKAEAELRKTVPPLSDLFFGRISGTMGVTSALLILIGGLYLFITRTASRAIILSEVIAYMVLSQSLNMLGVRPMPDALHAVLGGGFLFGACFMATDPISAPKTKPGQIIYGILIAVGTVVIRNFSIFNGGLMFSILLGNMFAPIIDFGVEERAKRKKAAAKPAEPATPDQASQSMR